MIKMMTWRREKIAAFGRVIPSALVGVSMSIYFCCEVLISYFIPESPNERSSTIRLNYGVRSIKNPYYSDALPQIARPMRFFLHFLD